MNFTGLPPTILQGSTSFITLDSAAITAPSPIVTPLPTVERVAIHTLSPIFIGASIISKVGDETSCDALKIYTSLPMQEFIPIFTFPRHLMQAYSPILDLLPTDKFQGSTIVAVLSIEQLQSICAPNSLSIATRYLLIKKKLQRKSVVFVNSHSRDLNL